MAVSLKVPEVTESPKGRQQGPGMYCFSVTEYHRMAETGILREDDRVELLRGRIVEMSPIGSEHGGAVNFFVRALRPLEDHAVLTFQNALRIDETTEPQPDVMVLKPREDLYRSQLPGPDDVLLLIEVADSSRSYDRSVKLPLYAEAGIVEVWVVDLVDRVVEVHRKPQKGRYGSHDTFGPGDTVHCAAFPDVDVSVRGILGNTD